MKELLDNHPDLREVNHGPTRESKAIGRSFSNFHILIIESGTLPPLETEQGRESDHWIAFALARFETPPDEIITYTHRPYTEKGAAKFVREIQNQTWTDVLEAPPPSQKADLFQTTLDHIFHEAFPLRRPGNVCQIHPGLMT